MAKAIVVREYFIVAPCWGVETSGPRLDRDRMEKWASDLDRSAQVRSLASAAGIHVLQARY
jgi:hypothetical protein